MAAAYAVLCCYSYNDMTMKCNENKNNDTDSNNNIDNNNINNNTNNNKNIEYRSKSLLDKHPLLEQAPLLE